LGFVLGRKLKVLGRVATALVRFVGWNRSEQAQVFECAKSIRPEELYISDRGKESIKVPTSNYLGELQQVL